MEYGQKNWKTNQLNIQHLNPREEERQSRNTRAMKGNTNLCKWTTLWDIKPCLRVTFLVRFTRDKQNVFCQLQSGPILKRREIQYKKGSCKPGLKYSVRYVKTNQKWSQVL